MKLCKLLSIVGCVTLISACKDDPVPPRVDGPTPFDFTSTEGLAGEGKVPDQPQIIDISRPDLTPDQRVIDLVQVKCNGLGTACAGPDECCTKNCVNKLCAISACLAPGSPCKVATECCDVNCTASNLCGTTACVADGQTCTAGGAPCCSTKCVGGKCEPLNPVVPCKTAGNPCPNGDADCCSKACVAGKCASPTKISYCTQPGDICFTDAECCTGACVRAKLNDAGPAPTTGAGTCATVTALGTTCSPDGLVCAGCSGCCSSFCAPFGLTAAFKICQPASGCHVTGDLCQKDTDCCGGDFTQLGKMPGAGLVKCIASLTLPQVKVCSEPNPTNCPTKGACGNNCVPEGNVCHYKYNGGCPSNAIRNDCCAAPGNSGECQLDKLGIPRCHGIGACVPAGGDCASSADCCGNLPCVPDAAGHLKCGSKCVPDGGVCTTTADCCTGLACWVLPGALQGVCKPPDQPPPVLTDGPKKEAGPPTEARIREAGPKPEAPLPVCALWGQTCSTLVPCCANQGTCLTPSPNAVPCTAGRTDCTCNAVIF